MRQECEHQFILFVTWTACVISMQPVEFGAQSCANILILSTSTKGHMRTRLYFLSVLAIIVAACGEPPMTPVTTLGGSQMLASVEGGSNSYVVVAAGNSLPDGFESSVAAAGGSVTYAMGNIGVALVTSANPDFNARAVGIPGIAAVVPDVALDFSQPQLGSETQLDSKLAKEKSTAVVGASETYRLLQWAPDAISAPGAWSAGYQGAGARVAIVDGGISSSHVDIAPNLDVATSRSFVPGFAFNQDAGTFWHGTHVAGIVAAPANGIGTVGIAPKATIIGVKVLQGGKGNFGAVIAGIYYSATPIAEGGAGADIVNMSLGALFYLQGSGAAFLWSALNRATSYAHQRGAVVVAAAGNNALSLDYTANLVSVPAQSVGVLAVSATGPMGWGLGSTDLDRIASYTNYGVSAIDVAGPGGDFVLPGNALCTKPLQPKGSITVPCWVLDMVLSPSFGTTSYAWAAGTSMASPAVAGVAALIVGKNPALGPSQVEAILGGSADDLGKVGADPYYGTGRVNALKAIQ